MVFGDSLNWMVCPAVIRRRVRNYLLVAITIALAAPGLMPSTRPRRIFDELTKKLRRANAS